MNNKRLFLRYNLLLFQYVLTNGVIFLNGEIKKFLNCAIQEKFSLLTNLLNQSTNKLCVICYYTNHHDQGFEHNGCVQTVDHFTETLINITHHNCSINYRLPLWILKKEKHAFE